MSKEKKNSPEEKEKSKGFFATLKCEPQTLEEANRKSRNKYILILIGAGLVCLAISFLLPFLGIFCALFELVVVFFFYLGDKKKNKRCFCPECGEKYDYEEGISWRVTEQRTQSVNHNSNSSGKQLIAKKVAYVRFSCTCLSCGNVREFNEKFGVAFQYSNGSIERYDISELTENYFRR